MVAVRTLNEVLNAHGIDGNPEYDSIKVKFLGQDDQGIDGNDAYYILTGSDDIEPADLEEIILPCFYKTTNRAGGYFCHNVSVMRDYSRTMLVVHHRFDV